MRRRGRALGLAILAAVALGIVGGGVPPAAAVDPAARSVPGMSLLRDVWCMRGGYCLGVGLTGDLDGGAVVVLNAFGPIGPVRPVAEAQSLSAIACLSSGNCIAVGQGWDGPVVVEVALDGTPGAVRGVQGATHLHDVACPTEATCLATGRLAPPPDSGDHSPGPPVFVVITNGAPAPAQPLPPESGGVVGIACPTTSTCLAVGGGTVVVLSDAGSGWTARVGSRAPSSGPGYVGDAISCPTSSRCYATAVGVVPVGGNSFVTVPAMVSVTADGVAGPVQVLSTVSGVARAVSCARGTAQCKVVGNHNLPSRAVVFDISRGSAAPANHWSNAAYFTGVSCVTQTSCGVVGSTGQTAVFGWTA